MTNRAFSAIAAAVALCFLAVGSADAGQRHSCKTHFVSGKSIAKKGLKMALKEAGVPFTGTFVHIVFSDSKERKTEKWRLGLAASAIPHGNTFVTVVSYANGDKKLSWGNRGRCKKR